MKDEDRFAGLGAEALSEAERESVVKLALRVMAEEVADGPVMTGETATARYLQLKAGGREREVFGCLFLTTRNRLICDQELFYGSIDRTTVHPRVILQKALKHNAAALICYHNHPSSVADPSPSDMDLTGRVKDLLDEIDVRLLDHIVVSRTETVSMAARGLI
ncbi:MAG: DNA repair protein RadC [Gammaproteobacteria bacterium]|nr:DNA repair protein RadC [Gammaproteobacteria bacterium]